jgi:nucleoside-diphosphate-sugar epimerase
VKSLITGAYGFIGRYLLGHLREVYPTQSLVTTGHEASSALGVLHFPCDLSEPSEVERVVTEVQPDRVYHLAGNSRVTDSIGMPEYFSKNFLTTHALVNALGKLSRPVTLFFASTVHVYGNQTGIATEKSPAQPVSPYGFTKYLAEEALKAKAVEHPQLRIVVGRLSSCLGPGQSEGFVAADLCRKLAKLPEEKGTLRVGPLTGFRRFVDVRDAVRLFPLLLQSPTVPFEIYNLASPHEFTVLELLELLLSISGKAPRIESSEDKSSNRFTGLKLSVEKMEKDFPSITFRPLEITLRNMYEAALKSPVPG